MLFTILVLAYLFVFFITTSTIHVFVKINNRLYERDKKLHGDSKFSEIDDMDGFFALLIGAIWPFAIPIIGLGYLVLYWESCLNKFVDFILKIKGDKE